MSATPHLLTLCLFLLSQVIAEWVEIEQNYHKPIRKVTINKDFAGIRNAEFEETTQGNRIYRNYSMDKQWGKGVVDRVSNIGNIRRVHDPSVKTVGIKVKPGPGVFQKNDVKNGDRSNYHESTVTPPRYNIFDKPYKTKIKLNPVNQSDKEDNTNYNNVNTGTKHTPEDFVNIETTPNDLKILHNGDKVNIPNRKRINQAEIVRKKPFKHEDREILSNFNDDHMNFQRINFGDGWTSKRPILSSTTQVLLLKNTPTTRRKDIVTFPNIKEDVTHDTMYPNISLKRPTHMPISTLDKSKNYGTHNQPILYKTKTDTPVENIGTVEDSLHEEELRISDSEQISNSSKADAINGMWRLMKVVTDTIYKNTHRSFRSKVKYLKRLRTTILTTIEDQIETIWSEDGDEERRFRRAREARGHLEFPSSESALMSISFLTFAVFLIKLVLQVIHTYKNKTMMVTPTVVTAVGRAAEVLRSRL